MVLGDEVGVKVEIDGATVTFGNGVTCAADILTLAGRGRSCGHVVIGIGAGRASLIDPAATILLGRTGFTRFRTFDGGDGGRLIVDGRIWVWGSTVIRVAELLDVAGAGDDADLLVAGGTGAALAAEASIDLSGATAPEFEVRRGARSLAVRPVPSPKVVAPADDRHS